MARTLKLARPMQGWRGIVSLGAAHNTGRKLLVEARKQAVDKAWSDGRLTVAWYAVPQPMARD